MHSATWLIASILIGCVRPCPEECRCDRARKRVYCNNRDLSQIPRQIPSDTRLLFLQDNELTSTQQLERELGKLNNLERLMLYNNKLDVFPKLKSANLRELRINNNRISRIPTESLADVPNLSNLILDANLLTNEGVELGALEKLKSLTRISLNRNHFAAFPAGFAPSIQQIFLSDNKISKISKAATENLVNLETIFLNRNKLRDESIDRDSFRDLSSLKELELSNNLLSAFPGNISPNVEKIYLTSNQMEYISQDDLAGLAKLQTLDLAYNRLRALERNSLGQLESLLRIDLSGNNWTCDCHLKPMKEFLAKNPVHYGAREQILCGDLAHTGQSMDSIHANSFACKGVELSVAQTNSAVLINSTTWDNWPPPFARSYRLRTEQLNTASKNIRDISVDLPVSMSLTDLASNTRYRFCLYSPYLHTDGDLAAEQCVELTTGTFPPPTHSSSLGLEVLIGSIAGCCLIALVLVAVLLAKRSRSLSDMFPFPPILAKFANRGENHEVEPSRLVRPYSSKITDFPHVTSPKGPSKYSNQPDLTLDASKEFNVTLMLRAPPPHAPSPPGGQQTSAYADARNHSLTSSSLGSDETEKTLLSSRHDLGIYL